MFCYNVLLLNNLELRIENSEFSMNKNTAKTFEDLIVWQKSHALVSIPANIAEGFRKKSNKDKVRFYNIAQGSLEECRYYLILANDLGYGQNKKINALLEKVSKLLTAYMSSLLNTEFPIPDSSMTQPKKNNIKNAAAKLSL